MQMDDRRNQYEELVNHPREDIRVELKPWLDLKDNCDRANLAQAILAMANSGGGLVQIGFSEKDGVWAADAARPTDLSAYSQDAVNGIVEKYAEPAFQCSVLHTGSYSEDLFPIVVVPGEHKTPIRSKCSGPGGKHVKKDTYYIRRPGPASAPVQTAREWDELIGRCLRCSKADLLDGIRQILHGNEVPGTATPIEPFARLRQWDIESRQAWAAEIARTLAGEDPMRFSLGTWSVSYEIDSELPQMTCSRLRDTLSQVDSANQGLALWPVSYAQGREPHILGDVLECALFDTVHPAYMDGYHSPFWRASPEGLLFLVKGHREDSSASRQQPGMTFDLSLPVYRIAEALLHAERLTEILAVPESLVRFKLSWDGLSGRELQSTTRDVVPGRIAIQDSVSTEIQTEAHNIRCTLPELVYGAIQPLCQLFALFDPGVIVIDDILKGGRLS